MLRTSLLLTVVLVAVLPQVLSENAPEAPHDVDKRNVGSLARTGQLPYRPEGKRYVAALARNGDLPFLVRKEWNKKLHPVMSSHRGLLQPEKRYVGALAKGGGIRMGKRDGGEDEEVETLLEDIVATEELRRLQLNALKNELLQEEDSLQEQDEQKRSIASLARSGNLPFREGKRSVEALARGGYLPINKQQSVRDDDMGNGGIGKRSVSTLAKNGQLQMIGPHNIAMDDTDEDENNTEDKRGGIGSLARNGYLHQKKSFADEPENLDELIQELYNEEQDVYKRNIGSLARNSYLPGKRNIGSLARFGGFPGLRYTGSKKSDNDIDLFFPEEEKRNLASLARSGFFPVHEGKRYLGSLARGRGLPFNSAMSKKDDLMDIGEEVKRNIGAMARNWHLPEYVKYGKRINFLGNEFDGDESDIEEIAKRYVAALLRQGRLPVGENANYDSSEYNFQSQEEEEKEAFPEEDKRHIGSLAASKAFQVHKKSSRSTGSDGKAYNSEQEPQKAVPPPEGANKTKREVNVAAEGSSRRNKRQAYLGPSSSSDEYPMPVLQNSDLFDYEDMLEVMSGGAAPEKRFLGRIPQMGRNRQKTTSPSGRRRPHLRNI
ncbi:neuropeptide-like 1 isoform X2 [Anabrus simplex]|uniref:neuropeptide-like 1 isoform X2 n=1 Tax=Anabrus simplex TaxID=316456 RepID=UPI0035A2FD58